MKQLKTNLFSAQRVDLMDFSEDCSIFIPTFNRPKLLNRLLTYYDNYTIRYKIIIADSSSKENKKRNKEIITTFTNLQVKYLDKYSSDIYPLEKVIDAINEIDTKYCVICADDDFVTPNGINQSVDFLEKNPDFAVAHGHYISFYLKTEKKGKQHFCWTSIYPYKSITFPDAKSRLNFHLSNYYPTFFAVHRTDFLKMILKESAKFTDDYRFTELLPSMLTLIHGKMKRLDMLYAARDDIPGSTGQNCEHLSDFIMAGTYDEKYAKFRDCLAMHLSKKSQLDVGESKKVIDEAMAAYMKKDSTNYKRILIHKMSNILDYLKLPDWVDEGVRTLYRRLFVPKQMQMDDFQSSVDVPASKYYDDFGRIRLHVLSIQIQRSDKRRK